MIQAEPVAPRSSITPDSRFLRNTWYPILWSTDLAPGVLVDRVVLGEPIVFYRDADGQARALADLCPHRFAPLHLGTIVEGSRIRCIYHGLEFDASGACALNPHFDGRIPANASVAAYPLAEKHAILWIWMGEREADRSRIPDFSVFDNPPPGTLTKFDSIKAEANYELITDNLLDLSHTSFLHEGLLGNPQMTNSEVDITQTGNTVTVSRYHRNIPVPAVYDLMFRADGKNIDMWDSMRWDAPGCFLLDAGITEPGTPKDHGTGLFAVHLLTPETAKSTHYLFSAVRQNIANGQAGTPEISAKIGAARREIFLNQDTLVIAAQQQMLDRYPERTTRPALFAIDAGPARYKRVLRTLLDAEAHA